MKLQYQMNKFSCHVKEVYSTLWQRQLVSKTTLRWVAVIIMLLCGLETKNFALGAFQTSLNILLLLVVFLHRVAFKSWSVDVL
jgi:hypothetical protein